ncbi:hypothetical protein F4809DRAFT_636755 [Biscogniauxia mediterranea]|nr:hypothetical protein F4809DRAFT_636755 [Biscogniauxia mediterranea]
MAEVDLILKWQQAVSPERDVDEPPLVAHLYQACEDLYSGILTKLSSDYSIDRSVLLSLQRSHSYLVLWADGYGVSDGVLDTSLDKSRRARHSTLRLLSSLLPVITLDQQAQLDAKAAAVVHAADKLKYLTQKDAAGDSDSDTSSDTSSVSGAADLDDIAEDLKTDSECLLDLGSRFDEKTVGATATEEAVDPTVLRNWDPSRNFVDRICWRYPQCDNELAERLGKANWARVLEYQKTKDQNTRPLQPEVSTSNPRVEGSDKASSKKVPSTTFHDSALGSSVPSAPPNFSQYAETVVSYHGGQGESVRIPALPEGAKNGIPFDCVGCGRTVTMVNKSVWKRHLFSDLKPYICLDGKCAFNHTPFSTKSEWEDHLTLDHDYTEKSNDFTCPICQEKISSGLVHVKTHLTRHLEEISLTILPTNLDSEDGTDLDSGLASSETSSKSQGEDTMDITAAQPGTARGITDVIDRIQSDLINPLLQRGDLKAFHSLILQTHQRMYVGMVLRDIEVALISGAQASAPSPELYQKFSLVVLNTIRGVFPLVEESGQTRPGERPYDEEYLTDAEKEVRRDARQMNDQLHQMQPNQESTELGNSPGRGIRNADFPQVATNSSTVEMTQNFRRRKQDRPFIEPKMCKEPGCQKKFVRPCDLIKHEKTHSRPWKCPVLTCKYHDYGWPTEKEMDRHVADKHSEAPAMFECLFKPCPYKSKRESNCKQHMEKSHGWTYVRTKTNGPIEGRLEAPPLGASQREFARFKEGEGLAKDESADAYNLVTFPCLVEGCSATFTTKGHRKRHTKDWIRKKPEHEPLWKEHKRVAFDLNLEDNQGYEIGQTSDLEGESAMGAKEACVSSVKSSTKSLIDHDDSDHDLVGIGQAFRSPTQQVKKEDQ